MNGLDHQLGQKTYKSEFSVGFHLILLNLLRNSEFPREAASPAF